MRTPSEKRLIDAVIDAEVEAKKLSEKAKLFGSDMGAKLTTVAKKIVSARVAGSISAEQARLMFRQAFIELTLAGFTEVAQEVVDHGEQVAADIHAAARELGPDLVKASPIRKADFLAREIEKASG